MSTMEQVLYALTSDSHDFPSFAWTCALAIKIDVDITVLGSEEHFSSSHQLRTQVQGWWERYRHVSPAKLAPGWAVVLRQEGLLEAVQQHIRQHPVDVCVFSHHFSPDEWLFLELEDQKHAFIHLSPDVSFDLLAESEESDQHPHAFYHTYHQARKHHLPHEFFHRLARDRRLPGFLVDYLRNQGEQEKPEY